MKKFTFCTSVGNGLNLYKNNEAIFLNPSEFNELIVFFAEHLGVKDVEEYLQEVTSDN